MAEQGFANLTLMPEVIQTGPAKDDASAIIENQIGAIREAWDRVIDTQLIEWGAQPEDLEDEELIPPTRRAITQAIQIAQLGRKNGVPAPMRVLPDRDGGIILEHWRADRVDTLEISRDGEIEWVVMEGGKVTGRNVLLLDE